jgi:AraC-like DNA-binding protein
MASNLPQRFILAHPIGRFQYENSFFECALSLDAGPFTVSRRRFPARFAEGNHFHERPYLQAILAGSLTESGLFHESGTVGFQPAAEHCSKVHDDGLDVLVVEMLPGVVASRLSAPAVWQSTSLKMAARSLQREMEEPDVFTSLAVEGIVYGMLVEVGRSAAGETARTPNWLRRVAQRLREETEAPASLEALAAEAAVHPATLSRAFRRGFGCSVAEYARRSRLAKASALLSSSEASIADIAAETGFTDQSHLGRWFRRVYGVSPSEFRNGNRA